MNFIKPPWSWWSITRVRWEWPVALMRSSHLRVDPVDGEDHSSEAAPTRVSAWLFPITSWGACCCCSVAKSCLTCCHLMNFSTPGSSVLHCLLSSVQSLSHIWLFATPWTVACQAFLSITNSWSLFKLMSIQSVMHWLLKFAQIDVHWVMVMPSNHLTLYRPLLLLPSIFPSIRVFSNKSALRIRWPKYWSFNFSIRSSNDISMHIDI